MENKDIAVFVRKIEQVDRHTLGIEWTDDHVSRWKLAHLRRNCPCATCRDEHSGKRLLDPKTIPDDLSAVRVQSVGLYALTIEFSDGHSTGIYPFTLLRELEEN